MDWPREHQAHIYTTLEKWNYLFPSKVTRSKKQALLDIPAGPKWKAYPKVILGFRWGEQTQATSRREGLCHPAAGAFKQRTVISIPTDFRAISLWFGPALPLSHAGRHCPQAAQPPLPQSHWIHQRFSPGSHIPDNPKDLNTRLQPSCGRYHEFWFRIKLPWLYEKEMPTEKLDSKRNGMSSLPLDSQSSRKTSLLWGDGQAVSPLPLWPFWFHFKGAHEKRFLLNQLHSP